MTVQRPAAVRGTLRVHVAEHELAEVPRAELRAHLARAAVTLSAVRERLGGDHGEIVDEFGDAHPLSLADWSDRAPQTRLTVFFTFQQVDLPEGFRGSSYPADVLSLVRARVAASRPGPPDPHLRSP